MTIKGIRRLVHAIVTAPEAPRVAPSPVSSAGPPSTARPPAAVRDADRRDDVIDRGTGPWAVEMAAPSFMILAVRPRREER